MTKKEIKAEILEYFKNNEDDFVEVIEALDDYNGYLDNNRWYEMEDLELFVESGSINAWDLLNKSQYGDFRIWEDFWRFDRLENLESSEYKNYNDYLDDNFVDELIDYYTYIEDSLSAKVLELIEQYENCEN